MGIPCVEPVCQEQCPYFKSLSIGGFAGGTVVKDLTATAGDAGDSGLIAESRRSPGEGNSNSLQYSCLEKPMDKRSLVGYGPWGHKNQTQLND